MKDSIIISRLLDHTSRVPNCHRTLRDIADFYQRTGRVTKPQLNLCEKLLDRIEMPGPSRITATISNKIKIEGLPLSVETRIKQALTFANPKYQDVIRMNRIPRGIPKSLFAYTEKNSVLTVPRGFANELWKIEREEDINVDVVDDTVLFEDVEFVFKGTLRPYQEEAVDAILQEEIGVLSAPTGSGKTVVALAVVAKQKQPTLIIVHRKELLHQWIERIETFLGIPKKEVGVIGDGRLTIGAKVTVGIVNSVYKVSGEINNDFGLVVVDECHRTPSRTFTEAISAFSASYLLGLSATPWRRDRLTKLIYWYAGPLIHEIPLKALQDEGSVLKARVEWKYTDFKTDFDPVEEYSQMLSELTNDPDRNFLIASDVMEEQFNGVRLVLTDRKAHVEAIKDFLLVAGEAVETLTGSTPKDERDATISKLKNLKNGILIATGQLIGEGFDLPVLTSLFLATPISFDGRVIQYLGRILRPAEGKGEPVVYDYCDTNVSVLLKSAKSRNRVYKKHGLKTIDRLGD